MIWQNRILLPFLLVPTWKQQISHFQQKQIASPQGKKITLPNPSSSAVQRQEEAPGYCTTIPLSGNLFPTALAAVGPMW